MSKIRKLEEINAWQEARELVRAIYALANEGDFSRGFGPRDQIRRASVSVMSDVAEGYARSSDREFACCLSIALGSAVEVQSQLYVALDQNYVDRDEFERAHCQTAKAARLIRGFRKHLEWASPGGSAQ